MKIVLPSLAFPTIIIQLYLFLTSHNSLRSWRWCYEKQTDNNYNVYRVRWKQEEMIHNFRFFEVASADVCGISLVFGNFHSILGGERDEKTWWISLVTHWRLLMDVLGRRTLFCAMGKFRVYRWNSRDHQQEPQDMWTNKFDESLRHKNRLGPAFE